MCDKKKQIIKIVEFVLETNRGKKIVHDCAESDKKDFRKTILGNLKNFSWLKYFQSDILIYAKENSFSQKFHKSRRALQTKGK